MELVEFVRSRVVPSFERAQAGGPGDADLDDVCQLAQIVIDRIDAGEAITPAMERVLQIVAELHEFHRDFPARVLMP